MSESNLVRINKVLQELNISLEVAVEFLQSNGHEIKKRLTTKVSSEQYLLLFKEFNSGKSDEFKTEEKIKKEFNKRDKRIYIKLSKEKKQSYRYKKVLSKLQRQRSDKYKNAQIVKGESIESQKINSKKRIKHTPEYYRLLKLKRTFLNEDYDLTKLCDYYFIKESWVLSELLKHFPEVKMTDKVTLEHLIYISDNFYDTLCEVKKYSETIDSKNPKTKPNYYKLIYTR